MAVAFDEMNGPGGDLRPAYEELSRWLKETPPDALEYRRQEAELLFRRIGITFAVYGDAEAQERLIPFDVIPRIMSAKEWTLLGLGVAIDREGDADPAEQQLGFLAAIFEGIRRRLLQPLGEFLVGRAKVPAEPAHFVKRDCHKS